MSQIEIIRFLKKDKEKWWFAHEICFFCGMDTAHTNILKSLRKLREYNEIEFKEIPKKLNPVDNPGNGRFMYRYKEDDIDEII